MKISRCGSARKQGWRSIELNRVKWEWDGKSNGLVLRQNAAGDFNGPSTYDYVVRLNLAELVDMLAAVSEEAATKTPGFVAKELSGSLRSLTRLAALSAGLATNSPVNDRTEE